jgi:hypothetical protein
MTNVVLERAKHGLVHLAYQPSTSGTFFSQSPTISQQYFSPPINQHEPPITSQINTFMLSLSQQPL